MMLIGDEPQSYPSYRDIALGAAKLQRFFVSKADAVAQADGLADPFRAERAN